MRREEPWGQFRCDHRNKWCFLWVMCELKVPILASQLHIFHFCQFADFQKHKAVRQMWRCRRMLCFVPQCNTKIWSAQQWDLGSVCRTQSTVLTGQDLDPPQTPVLSLEGRIQTNQNWSLMKANAFSCEWGEILRKETKHRNMSLCPNQSQFNWLRVQFNGYSEERRRSEIRCQTECVAQTSAP